MIKTEKSIATMTDEQFATIEKHKLTPYLGRPDDIANAAVYLASDDSRFVPAQLLCVDGGITAHMPHVAEFRAAFEADPANREVPQGGAANHCGALGGRVCHRKS